MRAFFQSRVGLAVIALAVAFTIHLGWPGAMSRALTSFGREIGTGLANLFHAVFMPLLLLGIVVYGFSRLIGIRRHGGGGGRQH